MSARTVADKHLEEAREYLKSTLNSIHQLIATKNESEFGSHFENDLYDIAKELNNLKKRL